MNYRKSKAKTSKTAMPIDTVPVENARHYSYQLLYHIKCQAEKSINM